MRPAGYKEPVCCGNCIHCVHTPFTVYYCARPTDGEKHDDAFGDDGNFKREWVDARRVLPWSICDEHEEKE